MDLVFQAVAAGLIDACSWPAIGFLTAGIVIGAVVGLLPGFGGPAMLAILMPFTWSLPPLPAFALLMGALSVTATTGDITAILLGVPGESISAAMVADGHAFARQGEAGRAIGAALMSSLLGAIFGALVLAVTIPVARPLMMSIGSPELFMLSVAGIAFIAPLVGTTPLKGLIAGALGLFIATIGLDPMEATPRFTFGSLFLWDGVGLLPVALGLFAIPEALALAGDAGHERRTGVVHLRGVWDGVGDAFRHWWLVIRCSAIGSYIGLVPGMGASVAQWIAYAHASGGRRALKPVGPSIEGVLGPGAANNATLGGALVPTLTFGIPGSVLTAVFMSALVAKGIVPGDAILKPESEGGHLSLVFALVAFLVLANVITVGAFVWLTGPLSRIADVRGQLLFPGVVALTMIGAFMERNAIEDLLIVAAAGVIGAVMVRLDWPRPPLLLGLALGPLAENRLFLSTSLYGWSWVTRPGVMIIALATAVALVVPRIPGRRVRANSASTISDPPRSRGDIACSLAVILMAATALVATVSLGPRPSMFPRVILTTLLGLAALHVFRELRRLSLRFRESGTSPEHADQAATIGWIAGFLALSWIAGFTVGLGVAVLAYLRLGARLSWTSSATYAVATGLSIELVLARTLMVPLPQGVWWR